MNSEDLQAAYIERLNTILQTVDLARLDRSCNSKDNAYACEILKQMHGLFTEVYHTDSLDYEYEFVDVPAAIRGRATGHICLGAVTLDLQSSASTAELVFIRPKGVDQGFEKCGRGCAVSKAATLLTITVHRIYPAGHLWT
jgi:hypothetical protein